MTTQGWILIVIALLLCGVSFYLFERDSKGLSKPILIYSIIAVLIVIGITASLTLIYKDNTFVFNLKRVCMLAILWPIAYIDFKEYRIPNAFITWGLVCRGLVLLPELFMEKIFLTNLISEVIAMVILLVGALLCRLMIKDSIGAGDMKLFIVMGLLLGLDGTWGAIFMSLIISFLFAVFLLLTKKKSRKDNIPFGPAIVLGTYISIFITGM